MKYLISSVVGLSLLIPITFTGRSVVNAPAGLGIPADEPVHAAVQIYEDFATKAEEGFGDPGRQDEEWIRNVIGPLFLSLQESLKTLQQIAEKEPTSHASQQSLGMAAFDLAAYKSAFADAVAKLDPEMQQQILPAWKLTDTATSAFQKCTALEPDDVVAYQRLATLSAGRKTVSDHRKALGYSLKAIEMEPRNPQGVSVLFGILGNTSLVNSPDSQEPIAAALKLTVGEARKQIGVSLDNTKAEILSLESELAALANPNPKAESQSRVLDEIDLHIASLESLKLQYPLRSEGYAPRFRGFLSGLQDQARDSGNFAARARIESDIAQLKDKRAAVVRNQSGRLQQAVREQTKTEQRLEQLRMIVSLTAPHVAEDR